MNNVNRDAYPGNVTILHQKYSADEGKEPYADVYNAILPANTIPQPYSVTANKTELRDLLNSELSRFPGHWSNVLWDHKATFKTAAANDIQNTDYNPYRQYNYRHCDWSHCAGMIHQSQSSETIYQERMSCGEKLCLRCDSNRKKRQAVKAVTELKALFKGMPGSPGIMFITFTLPESMEAKPIQDPELEKHLKNEICGIIKELFGVKTRSNIGLRLSVHAIGSKDVMRDRWHCHVEIIPGEVIKKNGEFKFHWLEPVKKRYRPGSDNPWLIDLKWLRDRWKTVLSKMHPGDEVANPQVEFYKYSPGKKKEKKYWARIMHKLSYNLRSFARDFENVFIRSEYETLRMILSGSRNDIGYWYNLTAYEVVDRFCFVRSRTLFRKRGFLSCLKKYKDAVILIYPSEDLQEVCYPPVVASILSIYEKQFDEKIKKWLTIRKDIWQWKCPETGKTVKKYSEDLKKWNQYAAGQENLEKE